MRNSSTGATAAGKDGKTTIEQLNSLLRGEISAIDTYRMAIDRLKGAGSNSGHVQRLQSLQREHQRASEMLRGRIEDLGGQVVESTGPWGLWAKLVQGAADLLGEKVALKSLKEGEEHGLKDYQAALDKLDEASVQLIRERLVPAQRQHIRGLNELMGSGGRN